MAQCASADRIKEVFRQTDVNGDGFISRQELAAVFNKLGQFDDDALTAVINAADKNKDGKLAYDEFVDFLMTTGVRLPGEIEAQIAELMAKAEETGMDWMLSFAEFDADGSGCLTFQEFWKGLQALGVETSETEAMSVFHDHDWTRNGRLSLQEFKDFLNGKKSKLQEAPLAEDVGTFSKSIDLDDFSNRKASVGVARRGTALECEDF
eukprot:gnl/TRDRNA2_/TRDRNA2_183661_c0_seq1.p1 gnl/TRDRNA2_/TRDRNA2_183661_c0~~gnl/TRDRNA2_/TRDRNA2_183661_c0_seq1.p1  ORF type:complete len:208 (+),score=47.59 gnl/TRDRNA2_/TRDRNA2_183661_c0_seq1:122-745(+)